MFLNLGRLRNNYSLQKYLKWCTTQSGRKIGSRINLAVNIGMFSALYFPHTFFLDKYRQLLQLYRLREPLPVPKEIEELFNEVVEDLDINEIDRKLIKPFMCTGYEPTEAGIKDLKTGAIIGIPMNFTYSSLHDVNTRNIAVFNLPVISTLQETEDFAESLILSRNAQKFAIARAILSFQESNRLIDFLLASTLYMLSYGVCEKVKYKYDMYKKPLNRRLCLYAIVGFAAFCIYSIQHNLIKRYKESKVDKKLADMGPDYRSGGFDYYKQILARNIALRKLLIENGKKLFHENGDPVYWLVPETTPITERMLHYKLNLDNSEEKKPDDNLKKSE